ncbi:hypothetical protein Hz2V087 [Helicoverpa zea nudivirus 2]|uniref:Uncharacterized protein n=1 Tax=Helicoverpa zea nudivirus 2 TaxID=1128424 RepID=G9I0B3_HZNV2|nr:orf087 gene product [Helicoverpa zea nudivirus 2]AEW69636.1 hypothetical protein Hz2V087 [Helicoverpa zea nudivirus 2]
MSSFLSMFNYSAPSSAPDTELPDTIDRWVILKIINDTRHILVDRFRVSGECVARIIQYVDDHIGDHVSKERFEDHLTEIKSIIAQESMLLGSLADAFLGSILKSKIIEVYQSTKRKSQSGYVNIDSDGEEIEDEEDEDDDSNDVDPDAYRGHNSDDDDDNDSDGGANGSRDGNNSTDNKCQKEYENQKESQGKEFKGTESSNKRRFTSDEYVYNIKRFRSSEEEFESDQMPNALDLKDYYGDSTDESESEDELKTLEHKPKEVDISTILPKGYRLVDNNKLIRVDYYNFVNEPTDEPDEESEEEDENEDEDKVFIRTYASNV